MRLDRLVLVFTLLLTNSVWAETKPNAKQAFFQEASDCAAAFEARVVERQAQPKSDARNQAMLSDTELGFTYVGVAYKKGLRNPEADQMLKAAEKRWSTLSKTEQQARLSSCTTKAQQLLNDVSGFERFIIKNRAKSRVDRLLQKERG